MNAMDFISQYSSESESEALEDDVAKSEDAGLQRVTRLVPRQVLSKGIHNVDPEDADNTEADIELKRQEGISERRTEQVDVVASLGDIFGVTKEPLIDPVEEKGLTRDDLLKTVDKFKADVTNERRVVVDAAEGKFMDEDHQENSRKRRKRKREETATIENFDVNSFYRSNADLVKRGELDIDAQIKRNSGLKYYSEGNNNLSHVINFTEKNKNHLEGRVEEENESNKKRRGGGVKEV